MSNLLNQPLLELSKADDDAFQKWIAEPGAILFRNHLEALQTHHTAEAMKKIMETGETDVSKVYVNEDLKSASEIRDFLNYWNYIVKNRKIQRLG